MHLLYLRNLINKVIFILVATGVRVIIILIDALIILVLSRTPRNLEILKDSWCSLQQDIDLSLLKVLENNFLAVIIN